MVKRTFKPQPVDDTHIDLIEGLPVNDPVAIYYRQSTDAQVGNISTSIQTIDMAEELVRRGWNRDRIILIDTDEGVSGTKRIDERRGMSALFEMIATGKIRAVACQDEDRLFRDVTQIQVNIFIEACRKSRVKVITPYFTYDFANPMHGDFHARQFRFKCEMAAEYIKSYIQGRLAPARQRLLKQGKWGGAKMPVGYMVDMRKHLPDGSENPGWRKFVPFEPYAAIVREYFRVFLENGGHIRRSLRQIQQERLSFPDCKPPDGFKISDQLKRRGDGYYLNRGNFCNLLTNPSYAGHWYYKGVVTVWNNHEPIIPPETFFQAFNYLSKFTLTGEENPEYRPAYQQSRPKLEETRTVERPLCNGLIFSTAPDGKSYRNRLIFERKNNCYLYTMDFFDLLGTNVVWTRRATWIDEAIVAKFKERLIATFKPEVWAKTVEGREDNFERERKLKQSQLSTVIEAKQNIVKSLATLTHPALVQAAEEDFKGLESEEERLTVDLARLEKRHGEQLSFDQAVRLFERAANNWDGLRQDERRNLLAIFIDRIDASDYNRAGDMQLTIRWQDGNSDELQLWHKPHAAHWTRENVEKLLTVFDSGATQLEVSAAFPDLKWYQLYNEIKKHRGLIRFTPIWLRKDETYRDYVACGGRKGKATCSIWRDEELKTLREMVERQATQIEIMQQFPYRRWIQLKYRINEVCGKPTTVPLSGISQKLTYIEYEQQQKTVSPDLNSEIAGRNF